MNKFHKIDLDLLKSKSSKFKTNYNKTLEYSKCSDRIGKSSHGATIVYKNKIIGWGLNRKKTHPLQNKYKKREDCNYLHAEIDVIVQTINKYGSDILKECSMIVCRTYKNGEVAASSPCQGCKKAIDAFKIKKVYYS